MLPIRWLLGDGRTQRSLWLRVALATQAASACGATVPATSYEGSSPEGNESGGVNSSSASGGAAAIDGGSPATPSGAGSGSGGAASPAPGPGTLGEQPPGDETIDEPRSIDPWLRQFGTEHDDSVRSVGVDSNGNVYVTGTVGGALPGQVSAGGSFDAFVRKYDASGNELWTRQFGSLDSDVSESVALDDDGVYVAGHVGAALSGQEHRGAWDVFVRKYTAAGDELWTRQFGSPGYDLGYVTVDGNGHVYVSGLAQDALDGDGDVSSNGPGHLFARQYDASGVELWTLEFVASGGQYLAGFAKADAAGLYFVGATDGSLSDQTSNGEQDGFVRKYASDGHELWTRQFGTSRSEGVQAAAIAADGAVYVAGRTFGAFPAYSNAGRADAYLRKYDSDGVELWTRQFGTATPDAITAVAIDAAGIVYVAGSTSGTLPGQTSSGSTDVFVRRYDASGAEIETRQFGTAGIEQGVSASVDGTSLYVAADTNGVFSDATNSAPSSFDAFVTKLAPF